MDNTSTIHSHVSSFDLKDIIHCKIQKSKAILTSVMFAAEFIREDMVLDNHSIYHALWAVDDYLAEISILFDQLN